MEMLEKTFACGLESRGDKTLLSLPASFAAVVDSIVPETSEAAAMVIVNCKRFVHGCRSLA